MADIFDAAKRSEVMSSIRSKNTKVELLVFRHLRTEGVYFQKHYRTKFGVRVDIALPRKKKAVFIDGDFWHGRTIDKVMARRGANDFWTKKLQRNKERDKEQAQLLAANGWTFLRAWESEIVRKATQASALKRIKRFLTL